MGTAREPKPAKYFMALLSSDAKLLDDIENELLSILSGIDGRTEPVPWTASDFYAKEMGPGLLRRFISFSQLRSPQDLAAIKLQTQTLEDVHRTFGTGGRRINCDPGYLDAFKIVLGSTKNAGQRIYLQSGIYGEVTLLYHDAAFYGLEYTYRDYLWPDTLAFFAQLRSRYLGQLRQLAGLS
jgi:uncharacterized protein DUF4416